LKDKYDEKTLEKILRAIDTDKNGAINYTEFVAATLN
jgi:Ca2+-binding EF-hand superfamily protein